MNPNGKDGFHGCFEIGWRTPNRSEWIRRFSASGPFFGRGVSAVSGARQRTKKTAVPPTGKRGFNRITKKGRTPVTESGLSVRGLCRDCGGLPRGRFGGRVDDLTHSA